MGDMENTGRKGTPAWMAKVAIAIFAALAIFVVAGYYWLDSDTGKRFIISQIEARKPENGLRIKIAHINGSIYDRVELKGITLSDPKGEFAHIPLVNMKWRPFQYMWNHIDINKIYAAKIDLERLPKFNDVPDDGSPWLPDIDIDIADFKIDRINIGPAITGEAHVATLAGRAKIADRRAQIFIDGRAVAVQKTGGGDQFTLILDAIPAANRLKLSAKINAPENGLITTLIGADTPMSLDIRGRGDWANWRGYLHAKQAGNDMAMLSLLAKNGSFTVKGDVRPDFLSAGTMKEILGPVLRINMIAAMNKRIINLNAKFAAENFNMDATGALDLGKNGFRDLGLQINLPRPSVLADNLDGDAISINALISGAFARPQITYRAHAGRLGMNDIMLKDLTIGGTAQIRGHDVLIPVNATARRTTGVSDGAAPFLTNIRLTGDMTMADGAITAQKMTLKSDRVNATGTFNFDIVRGRFVSKLDGTTDNYAIDGIGIFNIGSQVAVTAGGDAGFAVDGRINARSSKISSEGVRGFMGGNVTISSNMTYHDGGPFEFSRILATAPLFRLTGGQGTYGPDDKIRFGATGYTNRYGPMTVQLSGSMTRPVALVEAARPDMGVGLARLRAQITGDATGYDIIASGDSDYGPVGAKISLTTRNGPTIINVTRADFSGIIFSGQLSQDKTGSFTGRLTGTGSGVNGHIEFSDNGGQQYAAVNATAQNAILGDKQYGVTAGRAIIKADILFTDEPQYSADIQLARARIKGIPVTKARLKFSYRGDRGKAKLVAESNGAMPYHIIGNVVMNPGLWQIAAKGQTSGIDFATVVPLRLVPQADEYKILPSAINLGKGKITLSGTYGDSMNLRSNFNNVDLAIFNPAFPKLGLNGVATGDVNWMQTSEQNMPVADIRMKVGNFTRSGPATLSRPVDVSLVGKLRADRGHVGAILRRHGAIIGRIQLTVTPRPSPGEDWATRLLNAYVDGGFRYTGPADALFSLTALPDQHLNGQIGIAADLGGRLNEPSLTGVVRADNLVYKNDVYGTRLTQLRIVGTFVDDRLEITELSANAGNGTVTGKGFVSLNSAQDFPVQLNLNLANARIANSRAIAAAASGDIAVTNKAGMPPVISGALRLPQTRYKFIGQASTKVATLSGIKRKKTGEDNDFSPAPDPIKSLPSNWQLDLDLVAKNEVYISGLGLDSEWAAILHVTGTSDTPQIFGNMTLLRGNLAFAGRSFKLETGRLVFDGGDPANPRIDLTAVSTVDDITVRVKISGSGNNPKITFSSSPNLPQDEIMARILFGNSVGELSAIQAGQLALSLNGLRGGGGSGLNPIGVIQSATGIDRLRILSPDSKAGRGTALALGQYITNDVYVEIITDSRGYTASQIEISLSKALSVLGQAGSFNQSNINLRYKKNY